jgi:prephenate dehydrogenase
VTGFLFDRLAVIGVGLVGGSLAAAAKERDAACRVVGCGRSTASLQLALSNGVVDEGTTDIREAVAGADLVVLAGPVGTFSDAVMAMRDFLRPGCVVTDVGSVKGSLVRELEALMPSGVDFIGGHPIAGGSVSGVAHARADLFAGARVVLTPTPSTRLESLDRVAALWRRLGGDVVIMDMDEHDRVFAGVSHLPHLVAYALVGAVASEQDWLENAGKGFADTTRIASSPPNVWTDIFRMNRQQMINSVSRFEDVLKSMKDCIERSDWPALASALQQAKESRDRLGQR